MNPRDAKRASRPAKMTVSIQTIVVAKIMEEKAREIIVVGTASQPNIVPRNLVFLELLRCLKDLKRSGKLTGFIFTADKHIGFS